MPISFFELNNTMTVAEGNYEKALEVLNASEKGSLERAEKIFYFASNIEDDEYSLYAYNVLKNTIDEELASTEVNSEQYPLLKFSQFYCEKYALPRDDKDLAGLDIRGLREFVDHLYQCYRALDGIQESDFKYLKYQFAFDYETDWLWMYLKDLYEKIKSYKTKFGYNDYIMGFFDEDDSARKVIPLQVQSYFRDNPVKE
jgi:hypothetical protein|nr:MAG TPA: hypothetical protein [Bacteriophage sp.]